MALDTVETRKSLEFCIYFMIVVSVGDHIGRDLSPPLRVEIVYIEDNSFVASFFAAVACQPESPG